MYSSSTRAARSSSSRGWPGVDSAEVKRSSNSCISRSTTTAYSPSLPPKCSYTTGLLTFARAAISSMDVPSKPFSANSERPIWTSCSRRSRPVIRTRARPSVPLIAHDDPMNVDSPAAPEPLTYASYLRLPDLLTCQSPATDEHDELLFVVIHQVYELWFKQILHETAMLQRRLEDGHGSGALHTARRIAKILKTIVGQLDVLETMTPRQFAAFRPELGTSSGFQSDQFRELEAVLGRRDVSADDPSTAAALHPRAGVRLPPPHFPRPP